MSFDNWMDHVTITQNKIYNISIPLESTWWPSLANLPHPCHNHTSTHATNHFLISVTIGSFWLFVDFIWMESFNLILNSCSFHHTWLYGNNQRPLTWEQIKTIYLELALTNESATIICLLAEIQKEAAGWESFPVDKKRGPRYIPVGGHRHGEAVDGITRSWASCG